MTEAVTRRVDYHVHYNPLNERTAYMAIDLARDFGVASMTVLARSEISDNLRDFIDYGDKNGVEVIPGVEYMAKLDGKRVDLICLGFDYEHTDIRKLFGKEEGRKENAEIASTQKNFLEEKGLSFKNIKDINDQDLLKKLLNGETSEKAINFCEIIARNPNNKKLIDALVRDNWDTWNFTNSYCMTLPDYQERPDRIDGKFLYNLYFRVNGPGYVPVQSDVSKIVNAIHNAGGVVLYSPEGRFDPIIWENLQKEGLDGMMAWHGGKLGMKGENEEIDIPLNVIAQARRRNLLILGGSDYQQKDWKLGEGNGQLFISPSRRADLVDYIIARNNGKIPWVK